HQFLHDTQLCATSQLHFVQTALTAMGLQTHADIALHEVTPELLADAGFARSNEDMDLWLKQQLERERYWVFHTGHPTRNELYTWYRHTYGSTPNYELAPTWMIFEAANDARRATQQASAYSTTTTHTSHSSDHLLGPATRRLSLYESTDPLSARRPSFTSTSHYSTTRHFQPLDGHPTDLPPSSLQEHYQVPAQVTLPPDFIQSHGSQMGPFITAPIQIPVTIDLTINRPDPRDMQVIFQPQIEQRQELTFYVEPQMPQARLPMYLDPQLTQTTLPMQITPHVSHSSMQVYPAIEPGQMHVRPDIAQSGMVVRPHIESGQMRVRPDITQAGMSVVPAITPGQMPVRPAIGPAGMTVTPTFVPTEITLRPTLEPTDWRIT
ncbi:MAG: hypothetical protein ACRCWC_10745, partial [Plesiomonas shigelloides]